MVTIYDKPLLVIRNGEIRTEGYWKITVPGTVVLVSGQRFMFLQKENTHLLHSASQVLFFSAIAMVMFFILSMAN